MRDLTDKERALAREFFTAAIPAFRDSAKGNGAYQRSGIGEAFAAAFPGVDWRMATDQMRADKVLDVMVVQGGVVLFLWDERPESLVKRHANTERASKFAADFLARHQAADAVTTPPATPPVVAKIQTTKKDQPTA